MEASFGMPLSSGEQSTEDPGRVAAVSRRAMVRVALGTWLSARIGFPVAQVYAQTASATPSAGSTSEPPSRLELPPGITVVRDTAPTSSSPRRGGAIRLIRPGGI